MVSGGPKSDPNPIMKYTNYKNIPLIVRGWLSRTLTGTMCLFLGTLCMSSCDWSGTNPGSPGIPVHDFYCPRNTTQHGAGARPGALWYQVSAKASVSRNDWDFAVTPSEIGAVSYSIINANCTAMGETRWVPRVPTGVVRAPGENPNHINLASSTIIIVYSIAHVFTIVLLFYYITSNHYSEPLWKIYEAKKTILSETRCREKLENTKIRSAIKSKKNSHLLTLILHLINIHVRERNCKNNFIRRDRSFWPMFLRLSKKNKWHKLKSKIVHNNWFQKWENWYSNNERIFRNLSRKKSKSVKINVKNYPLWRRGRQMRQRARRHRRQRANDKTKLAENFQNTKIIGGTRSNCPMYHFSDKIRKEAVKDLSTDILRIEKIKISNIIRRQVRLKKPVSPHLGQRIKKYNPRIEIQT